jgi:hypothetical protein
VSTILEALRERDRRAHPSMAEPVVWRDTTAWTRWRRPAAAVVGLAAVAAGLTLFRPPPRAPEPASPAASVALSPRAAEPPALPPVAARDLDEAPRARVGRWKPAAPPGGALQPSRLAAASPVTSSDAAAPLAAATPTAAPGTAAAPTPAKPSLRLEAVHYAEAPGERTVTLAIDGAEPVTLRQGESMGGVDVQLILPAAVYVRRGADVLALGDLR